MGWVGSWMGVSNSQSRQEQEKARQGCTAPTKFSRKRETFPLWVGPLGGRRCCWAAGAALALALAGTAILSRHPPGPACPPLPPSLPESLGTPNLVLTHPLSPLTPSSIGWPTPNHRPSSPLPSFLPHLISRLDHRTSPPLLEVESLRPRIQVLQLLEIAQCFGAKLRVGEPTTTTTTTRGSLNNFHLLKLSAWPASIRPLSLLWCLLDLAAGPFATLFDDETATFGTTFLISKRDLPAKHNFNLNLLASSILVLDSRILVARPKPSPAARMNRHQLARV